jgi:histone H3/H4
MPQTVVTSAPARPVGVSLGKSVGSVASALLGRTSIGKKFARPLGVRPGGKMAGKHVATKKAPSSGGVVKKKRAKPGKRAEKEVKKYQNSVELELRKLPFQRCVREVVAELNTNQYDLKMQHEGLYYLQECTGHAVRNQALRVGRESGNIY